MMFLPKTLDGSAMKASYVVWGSFFGAKACLNTLQNSEQNKNSYEWDKQDEEKLPLLRKQCLICLPFNSIKHPSNSSWHGASLCQHPRKQESLLASQHRCPVWLAITCRHLSLVTACHLICLSQIFTLSASSNFCKAQTSARKALRPPPLISSCAFIKKDHNLMFSQLTSQGRLQNHCTELLEHGLPFCQVHEETSTLLAWTTDPAGSLLVASWKNWSN